MRTVYKYEIAITDEQTVRVPVGATFIHVGFDPNRQPCVWAEVDTDNPVERVELFVVGTGNPMPGKARKHIGSFNMGMFMWHIYHS